MHHTQGDYKAGWSMENRFMIGFGSEKGAPVPNYVNGEYKGLKRDVDGNTVISKLNKKFVEGKGSVKKIENFTNYYEISLGWAPTPRPNAYEAFALPG